MQYFFLIIILVLSGCAQKIPDADIALENTRANDDISDRPELGTAVNTDSILAVNAGEAAGSRLARILFTGTKAIFLGDGTWLTAPTADNQILQATGAGTFAWTSTLEGIIDDTKGDGDTTYIWSADKVFDQLALKANIAAPVFTTSIEVPYLILGSAATAADSGAVRMANNTALAWEPSSAGTDIFVALDDSDVFHVGQNAASISIGTSGTGNTSITGDLTVTGSDISVGAAGVKLTGDGDGAITFLGLGGGSDEDLTFNFDDVSNVVGVSTSTGVTAIRYDMALQAPMVFATYSGDQTLTAAAHNSAVVRFTAAAEATLWDCETAGIGQWVSLWQSGTNATGINPASGDAILLLSGTSADTDHEVDLNVTAAGTKVTLMCIADDTWAIYSETATSTDSGAQD